MRRRRWNPHRSPLACCRSFLNVDGLWNVPNRLKIMLVCLIDDCEKHIYLKATVDLDLIHTCCDLLAYCRPAFFWCLAPDRDLRYERRISVQNPSSGDHLGPQNSALV